MALLHCKTSFRDGAGGPEADRGAREETEEQEGTNEEPFLHCRRCLNPITPEAARITVNGAHQHAFANPHGLVFDIGCFQIAEGCSSVGIPTDEFTWFSGYRWRVALCRGCMLHMGWQFNTSSGSGRFFGLILDHLVASGK